MKATCTFQEAFVFHQLGVPVIAGFSPSHFHILGNPECGRMAHCEEGWYRAMCELSDSHTLRQEIANKGQQFASLSGKSNKQFEQHKELD